MAVVITKDSAVIACELSQIDIGKTVGNDLTILNAGLFFEKSPFSVSFEPILLKLDFSNGLLSSGQIQRIAQIGYIRSYLVGDSQVRRGIDRSHQSVATIFRSVLIRDVIF